MRIDSEGRDVTDLPGLWDESDRVVESGGVVSEKALKAILYRAIVELSYVQVAAVDHVPEKYRDLVASGNGEDIIRDGMALLDVADLSLEPHRYEKTL